MLDRAGTSSPLSTLWDTTRGNDIEAAAVANRKPVLLVVHQRHSSPGHVGHWFSAHDIPIDIRRPSLGDPLPETLEGHTGAVIFGGPQSANDNLDYIHREIDWIGVPLREEKPFLGICLGAQMMALHLGGAVEFDPDAHAEIGYYPVWPTEEGAALLDWPECFYHWHREGFTLPECASALAHGNRFRNQAFRFNRAFGVQFHPEITHALINRWSTQSSHRLALPGTRPRREHIDAHIRHGAGQRRWLGEFLKLWVTLDPDASR
ncbi:MAG: glutamine amidotransferase [Hyphomicrobiales bacterium]|nr:glutamine amidotransferase [Hyphomicrobiales bacterium]